jgi:hypothetical protein
VRKYVAKKPSPKRNRKLKKQEREPKRQEMELMRQLEKVGHNGKNQEHSQEMEASSNNAHAAVMLSPLRSQ